MYFSLFLFFFLHLLTMNKELIAYLANFDKTQIFNQLDNILTKYPESQLIIGKLANIIVSNPKLINFNQIITILSDESDYTVIYEKINQLDLNSVPSVDTQLLFNWDD